MQKPDRLDFTPEKIEGLLDRIASESLEKKDYPILAELIRAIVWMNFSLQEKELTMRRFYIKRRWKMKNLFKFLIVACCITGSAFANYLVVTSDQVSSTPQGLFVMVDGATIPVESVNMANDGYMVAIPTPMCDICPNCGSNKYKQGRFCPVCGFPDDGKYSSKKNASR
jgi:rubredoxin